MTRSRVRGLFAVLVLLALLVAPFAGGRPAQAAGLSQTFAGSGNAVIPLTLEAGLCETEWHCPGIGNFIVLLKDSSGATLDIIASLYVSSFVIGGGASAGVVIATPGVYYLEIQSSTPSWDIAVSQPASGAALRGIGFTGSEGRPTGSFPLRPGTHAFTWSHAGSGSFTVVLMNEATVPFSIADRPVTTAGPGSGMGFITVPSGVYSMTAWTAGAWQVNIDPGIIAPVYRFYNFTNNTHFFTPSAEEADFVKAVYSRVYRYEGVAYYANPDTNTQPLYRFYNRRSASHFYTASVDEADYVIANYGNVFTYEGETYKVSPTQVPNSTPVYRFFNRNNGSHFFTASLDEANSVILNYANVYTFEGPAYYLAP